jgi:hypothetical protein
VAPLGAPPGHGAHPCAGGVLVGATGGHRFRRVLGAVGPGPADRRAAARAPGAGEVSGGAAGLRRTEAFAWCRGTPPPRAAMEGVGLPGAGPRRLVGRRVRGRGGHPVRLPAGRRAGAARSALPAPVRRAPGGGLHRCRGTPGHGVATPFRRASGTDGVAAHGRRASPVGRGFRVTPQGFRRHGACRGVTGRPVTRPRWQRLPGTLCRAGPCRGTRSAGTSPLPAERPGAMPRSRTSRRPEAGPASRPEVPRASAPPRSRRYPPPRHGTPPPIRRVRTADHRIIIPAHRLWSSPVAAHRAARRPPGEGGCARA